MSEFGIKELDTENWLKPDPAMLSMVGSGENWLTAIRRVNLHEGVPADVRKLFEVARGTFAYGYLFYPLYTLSYEQVLRVAEAALIHKCRETMPIQKSPKFEAMLKKLIKDKNINEDEEKVWRSIQKARNYTSHPDSQTILTPSFLLYRFEVVAERINALFIAPP